MVVKRKYPKHKHLVHLYFIFNVRLGFRNTKDKATNNTQNNQEEKKNSSAALARLQDGEMCVYGGGGVNWFMSNQHSPCSLLVSSNVQLFNPNKVININTTEQNKHLFRVEEC